MKHLCDSYENMVAWCGIDTMSLYVDFKEVECIPCLEKFITDAEKAKARLKELVK